MSAAPKIKLNNGLEIPALGLGTYLVRKIVKSSQIGINLIFIKIPKFFLSVMLSFHLIYHCRLMTIIDCINL